MGAFLGPNDLYRTTSTPRTKLTSGMWTRLWRWTSRAIRKAVPPSGLPLIDLWTRVLFLLLLVVGSMALAMLLIGFVLVLIR